VQQIGMKEVPARLPDAMLARCALLPRKPDPVVLTGERVVLRPLDVERDCEGLHAISCGAPVTLGDRRIDAYDPEREIWRWMKGSANHSAAELRAYLTPQAAIPDLLLLVVLDRPTSAPIGVAAYMANHPEDLKIELGHIWYGPIAQGTGAAREATHLMLGHAFALGYRRVEWKCDALNERSRRSALSYGFTYEGTQDCHMIVKGRSRDTAWFRMLETEWPQIQQRERSAPRSRAR
jgi:RimJ/RimL family protein N-acetyltransferase